MKKLLMSLSIVFTTVFSYGQSITQGNNKFALSLLQKLANSSENCFYSPYSISTALFMTTGGAKANTEKEMLNVLCQAENTAAYHKKFGELTAKAEKKGKIQLNVANSIWIQKGYNLQQSYVDLLVSAYKAKPIECNFRTNPDFEAKVINRWVELKTKEKIKNLISPGILSNNTRMVLVNAIYFYSEWDQEFKKEKTKEDNFYLTTNKTQKASFMHSEYEMKYAADKDFQLLSIPYQKNEASMLVFLPKLKQNFDKYLESLTYDKYASLVNQLDFYKVNLTLPKFTMTTGFELGKVLSEMGMPSAFSGSADFSGITGKKDFKIDQVIHKAFVDVSEKGTEAAGATAVTMNDVASAEPEKEKIIYFIADHPFIFMIRDNATGQILFAGVVNKPGK